MDDTTPDPETRARDRTRDALLVTRLRDGDERAFGEIYDAWYDRVRDLASRIVRDPHRADEVAQDTFLSAWRRLDTLDDPASLGGWLLRIARNRALNVIEKEGRSVAVDDDAFRRIEAAGPTMSAPDGFRVAELAHHADPAHLVEDDEVVALLWSAADALGERDRTVLDLQLRHGLTPAEIGEVVGVNRNAANQLVHRVKGRLESAVGARVLWRGDRPSCEALQAALDAAGVDTFDSRAVTITNNHAATCDDCGERQKLRLQPTALFGAMPILMAPFALKQQAAAALAAEGVPMQGSTAMAGGTGTPSGASEPGASDGGGDRNAASSSNGAPPAAPVPGPAAPDGELPPAGVGRDGRRRTALVAASVLAVLLLAGGIGMMVAGEDDTEEQQVRSGTAPDRADELAADPTRTTADPDRPTTTSEAATTSTTRPSTSTTSTTNLAQSPPEDGNLPIVVPPTVPVTTVVPAVTTTRPPGSPTTTTPPPTATASITITPATVPGLTTYLRPDGPEVEWNTSGGASVEVFGANFSTTTRDGVGRLCPSSADLMWSFCVPTPGTYVYRVLVRNAAGTVIASDRATLTVS